MLPHPLHLTCPGPLLAATRTDGIIFDDGEWHMLTVSTLPGSGDTPWAFANNRYGWGG